MLGVLGRVGVSRGGACERRGVDSGSCLDRRAVLHGRQRHGFGMVYICIRGCKTINLGLT
jgi:hypothetical protein